MENESEKFKSNNNKINFPLIHSKKYGKIYIVIFLQIIILLMIILFYAKNTDFRKNQKLNLFCNQNANDDIFIDNNLTNELSKKVRILKILTNNDEIEYKGMLECLLNDPDEKYCIYHLISPKQVLGKHRILLGGKSDGGYVLLDDFDDIKIAYSFGIDKRIQFDKALADRGIDVYMYDHTINSLPFYNPKFHWKKIGLCGKKRKNINLKSLDQLLKENGHFKEKNMILKLDIEHWEWESINELKEDLLKKFKYIVIEFHFRKKNGYNNKNLYYDVLKKLSKTHQSFYVRCNGNRSRKINFGNNRICNLLEVSYIIKNDNKFIKDETIYPAYEFDYIKPVLGKLETNLNILKLFDK